MIDIRPPAHPAEVRQIEDIQLAAWGDDLRSITPDNVLLAWMHAGGIVLGAFDDAEMVGFTASFPAEIEGKRAQWSHLTAVLPAYRRHGLGRLLKFAQREHALQRGYDLIGWTFDPLRRENALFNFEGLGASCHMLHLEFYGQMTDGLNQGLLTDRFEVHWRLKDKQVKQRINGKYKPNTAPPETYVAFMRDGKPCIELPDSFNAPEYAIQLPADLESLRGSSAAHEWNLALRAAILPLFADGYSIERVICPDEHSFVYVLSRAAAWFLYVVETADGSFYTGITPDVDKRIATHNAGRGAKYTAVRRPVRLVAVWETSPHKARAMQVEYRFKRLPRRQKQKLIQTQADFEDAKRIPYHPTD